MARRVGRDAVPPPGGADRLHKDNISGGPPYGIVLPDEGADGHILADVAMPFVSYLRMAFDAGGFPRRPRDERQDALVRSLATGLQRL